MTNGRRKEPAASVSVCTMAELSRSASLNEDFIVQCVQVGITELAGGSVKRSRKEWRFSTEAVLRLQKARRLQRDLDMELSDLALVLDLLDEVESLRSEVDFLRGRLRHWER